LALVGAFGVKLPGFVLPNPFLQPADPAVAALREREVAARFTFTSLVDPKLGQRLHRIAAPTLVVWGEHDAVLPLAYGRGVAAAIPGARFATVDCGHAVPMERPSELATLLADFFGET
jgi:pimeloyl-ACP methyl ester carboxylesterase